MSDYGDVIYVLVFVGLVLMALGALGLVPAWVGSWIVGLAGPVVLLVSFLRRGLEAALAGALLAAVLLGLAMGVAGRVVRGSFIVLAGDVVVNLVVFVCVVVVARVLVRVSVSVRFWWGLGILAVLYSRDLVLDKV